MTTDPETFEQGKQDAAAIILQYAGKRLVLIGRSPSKAAGIHYGTIDPTLRQSNLPRKSPSARRKEQARNVAKKRTEALENGGPEKLDVADLRQRLAKRNESE